MTTTNMSQMWALLKAHTVASNGEQRAVNHLNEWGGYSDRLGMPVFTGWRDHTKFDKVTKTVTALVSDTQWTSAVGVNNQERWLKFAEEKNGGVAAFFVIHAVDERAEPRKVKYIDDGAIFVGPIVRKGHQTFVVGKRQLL